MLNTGKHIQQGLEIQEENTFVVDDYKEFKEKIEEGGFLLCHWDGTLKQRKDKEEKKSYHQCIPFDSEK